MSYPVAVIIPCKNHGQFLARAVTSALSAADEVIIVNDHSEDDTPRIAADLVARYPGVAYIENSGTGVVAARNTGIAAAQSALIIPCDADDYLVGLWTLVRAWSPDTWVYSDYYLYVGGTIERRQAPPPGVLKHKNVTHATICFAKTDWERVGGYDPDFELCCEDWAFTIALTEAGIKPKYIPDATYIRAAGGRSRACLRHAKEIRRLLADKYGRLYA